MAARIREYWLIPVYISCLALIFLLITLFNLHSFNIGLFHPHVLVEFGIFVVFLALGLYLRYLYIRK